MSFWGFLLTFAIFWVVVFSLNLAAWSRIERQEGVQKVDRVLLAHPITMAFALLAAGICICANYARRANLSMRLEHERANLEHEHQMRLMKMRHAEIEKAAQQDVEL